MTKIASILLFLYRCRKSKKHIGLFLFSFLRLILHDVKGGFDFAIVFFSCIYKRITSCMSCLYETMRLGMFPAGILLLRTVAFTCLVSYIFQVFEVSDEEILKEA